ncbi:hypothetical protein [Candidatus Mycoplasma haematohominis]|uniref:Uncharacterized protein n=1 Tax=Candidatus Mycoplasma haematohominis TaxID=1494318 RepID=A0A478FRW8_9MOLU|nr:hypothetical protein [Candidatus Mycoplasma haemohominis]GCE63106.1 hypothetical protein MHSWG343_00840 [Candidatus Mycoplasma haemohominis]
MPTGSSALLNDPSISGIMDKLGCGTGDGLDGWEKKFCGDARKFLWWLQEKERSNQNDLPGRREIFSKLYDEKERAKKLGGFKEVYDPLKEDLSYSGFIDGLGCGFGSEDWLEDICGEAYSWWWKLSDDKKDPTDPLEAGHKRMKFYGLQRDKSQKTGKRPKRVEMPKKPKVEWKFYNPQPTPQTDTPKPKEQPKKKRTKPGTFGYYGWYVDWGI